MAVKVLIDDRYKHRDEEYVSINTKLSRLLLYKKAYELMRRHHGRDVDYVQILTDDDRPSLFWLKPCDQDEPGSRKLDKTSENTRTLSIRALLGILKLKQKQTVRFLLEWDKDQDAARVDISQVSASE